MAAKEPIDFGTHYLHSQCWWLNYSLRDSTANLKEMSAEMSQGLFPLHCYTPVRYFRTFPFQIFMSHINTFSYFACPRRTDTEPTKNAQIHWVH